MILLVVTPRKSRDGYNMKINKSCCTRACPKKNSGFTRHNPTARNKTDIAILCPNVRILSCSKNRCSRIPPKKGTIPLSKRKGRGRLIIRLTEEITKITNIAYTERDWCFG